MRLTHRDLPTLRVDDAGTIVVSHGSLPPAPARPGPVGTWPGMLTSNVDGQSKIGVSAGQFDRLLPRPWETPDVR